MSFSTLEYDGIHSDLIIFGHWVLKIYKNFQKLRKRKFRGYCYVVIETDVRKKTKKFEKTENYEGKYI